MKFQIDEKYLYDCFQKLVKTPSPVGYYAVMNPVMEQLAESFEEHHESAAGLRAGYLTDVVML